MDLSRWTHCLFSFFVIFSKCMHIHRHHTAVILDVNFVRQTRGLGLGSTPVLGRFAVIILFYLYSNAHCTNTVLIPVRGGPDCVICVPYSISQLQVTWGSSLPKGIRKAAAIANLNIGLLSRRAFVANEKTRSY